MISVVDKATGQTKLVDDEEAQRGLARGEYGTTSGAVPVRNRDGDVGTVPADQIQDALHDGYTLSNDQELHQAQLQKKHGGLGGIAAAGAEGAARGLSFGLSDAAARAIDDDYANQMKERQEVHPIAATVGEVGGALAPILASGGAAAAGEGLTAGSLVRGAGILPRAVAGAGEAAGAAARGIVGTGAKGILGQVAQRAAPMAVQGAVEGAAYGVGHEISEAALGDTQLTAERVLAGAGKGALFGGGAGAVLGTTEAAVSRAADAGLKLVGKESVEDFFRSFANERTIKALGATQRDIQRLGNTPAQVEQRMEQISDSVLNYRFKDGEKLFRATSSTDELADKTARAMNEEGSRIGSIYKQADKAIARGEAQGPQLDRFFQELDEQVLKPLVQSDSASMRARAQKILDETGSLRNAAAEGEPITVERLVKARQDIQKVIQPPKPAQMGMPAPPPEHAEQLIAARSLLQDEIDRTIAGVGGELGTEYQTAKRLFGDFKDANKLASRWSVRDLGNRAVSPTDYLTGIGSGVSAAAAGMGGVASLGTGLLTSAAHNLVRERGSAVLASMADGMANKIASLNAARTAAAIADRELERGVQELLGPALAAPKAEAAIARAAQQTAYERHAEQVQQMAGSPEAVTNRLAAQLGPIEPHAPQLAAGIAGIQARKLEYLKSQLPPSAAPIAGVLGLQPHLEPRAPLPGAQAEFLRKVNAAEHPREIPARLGKGELTPEDAEVLTRLFPEWKRQIQDRVLTTLAKTQTPLSFQARMQLGYIFDAPVDAALAPAFVQDMQAMYAQVHGGSPQKPGGPPAQQRPKKGHVKVSGGMMTTAQRVQFDE
jgi:hypothetical protein